ncbi:hypothetical protein LA080_011497 [Diaporthe eres]|nr:hypothetical protein LA080_011497 [Diaporthe eres]
MLLVAVIVSYSADWNGCLGFFKRVEIRTITSDSGSQREDNLPYCRQRACANERRIYVNFQHSKIVPVLGEKVNDEITEVIHGIRHLMARRVVLLCYSARSGSMFQRLTVQKLAAKFSLNLDGKMHDEAIESYITMELARRIQSSQTGLFSHRLEELVKKQLIAGAHGMFLWVTLQLDSIFPGHSRTVVTHEQILNLIYNLPKDLPEAFERALEEIIDDRYGDSIMKIIMAAQSPLTLDELRVALTVVPGDPVWYAAKTPADAIQLIALCGGNLLELDEEDGKVRFIHYSVLSHLHQTTENPRTALYHSSPEEADILVGAICVTFLNMRIFDTDVAATNKITGEQFAEKAIGAASHQNSLLTHLAHHFMKRNRHQPTPTDFDIGRLMAEIQAASTAKFNPHCFQGYAMSNWLSHSAAFKRDNSLCMKVWHLWLSLLWGHVKVATIPFRSPVEGSWPALSWALMNHHKPLVYAIFDELTTEPTDSEKFSQGIAELTLSTPAKKCDPFSLGLILAHLFQLVVDTLLPGPKHEGDHSIVGYDSTSGSKVLSNLLYQPQKLLDLGADPMIPHNRNGNTVLKMLLEILSRIPDTTYDGLQSYSLLIQVLIYKNPRPLLQFTWVPYALRRILEHGNTLTFVKLLSYRPEVHIPPKEDSLIGVAIVQGNDVAAKALISAWPEGGLSLAEASYINGQPAIQLALETEDREMVKLLAHHGGLNTSSGITQFLAPLLRIALERMSVWWVELLLQLGAAPNLGYQASIEEPIAHAGSRYHLQEVVRRNQALKFLTLVRYGADARLPGFRTIRNMITYHDNQVLMARLKEMELSGPTQCSETSAFESRDEIPIPGTSALLEACKVLAEDVNENQTFNHSLGSEGDTALHYLAGAKDWFRREARIVMSHLLTSERALPGLVLRNRNGQTPLHRAIENGSRNRWLPPYIDSVLFLSSYIRTENSVPGWPTADDGGILGFAMCKLAPIDDVIKVLLRAGSDPNGTWKGETPLKSQ